jgi:hypothetical protein
MDNLLACDDAQRPGLGRPANRLWPRCGQWANELGHVAQIVGAFDSFEKHGGQDGVRFTPYPQGRAGGRRLKFLNENAFATPTMLLRPGSCGASSRPAR